MRHTFDYEVFQKWIPSFYNANFVYRRFNKSKFNLLVNTPSSLALHTCVCVRVVKVGEFLFESQYKSILCVDPIISVL